MSTIASSPDDGGRHYNLTTIWKVCGIAWGAISYAYAASIIGTTLGQASFLEYMELDTRSDADGITGTLTGLYYAGGIFGCLLNGYLADHIGRKGTAITAYITLLISSACLAGSVNVAMFIVFRFFVGASAYMLYLTTPLWVVELVPPHGRSITAGIVGLFGVIGYILAAYVGVGFHYLETPAWAQWRAPLALGVVPPLAGLVLMPWLPESPRWLLAQDRVEEAYKIVTKLHGRPGATHDETTDVEFAQMKNQSEITRQLNSSWLRIFNYLPYRKRALMAIMLPFITYTTGNLVITTYAASIFAGMGYNATQSLHFLAGIYLAAIAGNLISLTYVDHIPRNIIMSVGVLATTIILAIETILVATANGRQGHLAGAAAFIFLFLFVFNLFLEGPTWYYVSEIFPTHIRAKGMTINTISLCCTNLLWLEVSPTLFAVINWKFYLVFISLSVVGAVILYTMFPNTLRQPLEDIAQLFGDEPFETDTVTHGAEKTAEAEHLETLAAQVV
ncbi:general substrate transporter [Aspergillus spectabilis]